MNTESWEEIPEKRREAILRRRQAEEAAAAAGGKKIDTTATIAEHQPKLAKEAITARLNARRNAEKTCDDGDATRDGDLLKEHGKKLEELTARIEELSTSNKNLVEKNKQLEDTIVQVAEKVGIPLSWEVQIQEEKK